MEQIGKKIEKLRKQADMTQEELAFELNTTRQTISKWESGEQLPRACPAVPRIHYIMLFAV